MTAQIPEKLLVGDITLAMTTEPVYRPPEPEPAKNKKPEPAKNKKPEPTVKTAPEPLKKPLRRTTALQRGRINTWKIKDNRLYYKQPVQNDPRRSASPNVDGGYSFASTYSGVLRTWLGECIRYVHMGFYSTHEHDAFFSFSQGKIEASWVLHNSLKACCYPERAINQVKLLTQAPGIYYCKHCHILATSIGRLPAQTACAKFNTPVDSSFHRVDSSVCRHKWAKIDMDSDYILQCNSCGKIVSKTIQNPNMKCNCLSEKTKVNKKNIGKLKKLFNPDLFANLDSHKFNLAMIRNYSVRRME